MPRPDPTAPIHPTIRLVADSRKIPLRDEVVACVVTSPPYNVGIPNYPSGYKDWAPWTVYYAKARLWAREMGRILVPGGRCWLNIQPTVPETPGIPSGARVNLMHLWMEALTEAGLTYRDTIAWVQDSFDGACAWGSWCRPSAPNLRGSHEMILLYHKGPWKRTPTPALSKWQDDREGLGGDWVDLVRNVWKINPANNATGNEAYRGKKAVAAYPIELPARAIRLSTWPHELVVDPFAGRGTTGWAAEALGRRSVLLDVGYNLLDGTGEVG